jgi:hypothetical protein
MSFTEKRFLTIEGVWMGGKKKRKNNGIGFLAFR